MRALAVILSAVAVGGCAGQSTHAVPSTAPGVALGLGQEVADIDAQLAGAARTAAPPDGATRRVVHELWSRAQRADRDVRRRLDAAAPGASALLAATHDARSAAEALQAPRPDAGRATVLLSSSAAALGRAAGELAPRLPESAGSALDRLRSPLPPG